MSVALEPITKPYLLCSPIKCFQDDQGRRYLNHLWYKDLKEHLKYLPNFTLACPVLKSAPPENEHVIALDDDPDFQNVKIVDLPFSQSFLQGIVNTPKTMSRLWKAIGDAEVVHSGVAGWPIPDGWLLTPMIRWLRKRFYIIVIESAPWRIQPGAKSTITKRLRATVSESLSRWCVNSTDLAIFTQQQYKDSFLTRQQPDEHGHVIHASWIDDDNIISNDIADDTWKAKIADVTSRLRILFAGRLAELKGIQQLLDAMHLLQKRNVRVRLDILGNGEMYEACESAANTAEGSIKIEMLGTVPYGPKFFQLLQNYHSVVIPSLSDEQPRIVYDAYSQAVPVLASNTDGLSDCIADQETGLLVEPGNVEALANKIAWMADNLDSLHQMGITSLDRAREMTHWKMHERRWELLQNQFEAESIQGTIA